MQGAIGSVHLSVRFCIATARLHALFRLQEHRTLCSRTSLEAAVTIR